MGENPADDDQMVSVRYSYDPLHENDAEWHQAWFGTMGAAEDFAEMVPHADIHGWMQVE